jgi:hypothetical protein
LLQIFAGGTLDGNLFFEPAPLQHPHIQEPERPLNHSRRASTGTAAQRLRPGRVLGRNRDTHF